MLSKFVYQDGKKGHLLEPLLKLAVRYFHNDNNGAFYEFLR